MSKFCTQCGAQMPDDNAFCTNCGAKFAANTVPAPAASTAVPHAKVVQDIPKNNAVPPQSAPHFQAQPQPVQHPFAQVQPQPSPVQHPYAQAQPQMGQPAYTAQQAGQNEFSVGRQFMDANNPSHNYIQAINHLQKAASMGVSQANIYMAIAYLSQAVEVLKASAPQLAGMMPQPGSVMPTAAPHMQPMQAGAVQPGAVPFNGGNGRYNMNPGPGQMNPQMNNNSQQGSTLGNMGKYAAAAAVGAVAGSVLTNAANASAQEHTASATAPHTSPEYVQPVYDYGASYADPYVNSASDSLSSANEFIADPAQYTTDTASDYIQPLVSGSTDMDPAAALNPAAGLEAAENPDEKPEDKSGSGNSSDSNSSSDSSSDSNSDDSFFSSSDDNSSDDSSSNDDSSSDSSSDDSSSDSGSGGGFFDSIFSSDGDSSGGDDWF